MMPIHSTHDGSACVGGRGGQCLRGPGRAPGASLYTRKRFSLYLWASNICQALPEQPHRSFQFFLENVHSPVHPRLVAAQVGLKAKFESNSSHVSLKCLVPGGFNMGFIESTCTAPPPRPPRTARTGKACRSPRRPRRAPELSECPSPAAPRADGPLRANRFRLGNGCNYNESGPTDVLRR